MNLHNETQGVGSQTNQNEKYKQPSSGINMENLPREIILHILSKLPFSSLIQFKYVCRAWRNWAQDLDVIYLSNIRLEKENGCLIFHTDYPNKNELSFIDIEATNCTEEDKVKKIQTPFFASTFEFDVVLSCNGLLCLSDSLCNIAYIYNPFTRDYRELPTIQTQYPNQEVLLGFGFHPKTKEYKVVKIIYYWHEYEGFHFGFFGLPLFPESEVQVLTLGSSSWRNLGKIPQYLDQSPSQVLVNGSLHWLICPLRYRPRRDIISFDLADEKFKEVPKPDVVKFSICDYLVVLKDCLSAVFCLSYGELEIWVMKEYGVKESWVKEFNIGRYVPKALQEELVCQSFKNSKIRKKGRSNSVLCSLSNGEILIEKKGRALVLYDPNSGKFKDVMFQGMPFWFETVVHLGSLKQMNTIFEV